MGILRGIGTVFSNVFDVRVDKWVGYDYLKNSIGRSTYLINQLFKIEKPKFKESFEEAVERLALTEEMIVQRQKEFLRLSITFCFIALCIFSYAFYLAYCKAYTACMIAFLFTMYSLIQALRFHFWYFQTKNRKLGYSLKEWFQANIIGSFKGKARG